jgi:hypothetical protein
MAVAFDAVSSSGVPATGNLSFTHTPVGTPRAIIVMVVQATGLTDEVTDVTYGGVTMTEMTGSPLSFDATRDSVIYAYFLGSSIPTGAQTVAVTVNGTGSNKNARCFSLTASADTEVVDTSTFTSASTTSPSVGVSLGGRTSFVGAVGNAANADISTVITLTDWTRQGFTDFSQQIGVYYSYDIIGTSDVTAGWTQNASNASMIAFAVSEVQAGGGAARQRLVNGGLLGGRLIG